MASGRAGGTRLHRCFVTAPLARPVRDRRLKTPAGQPRENLREAIVQRGKAPERVRSKTRRFQSGCYKLRNFGGAAQGRLWRSDCDSARLADDGQALVALRFVPRVGWLRCRSHSSEVPSVSSGGTQTLGRREKCLRKRSRKESFPGVAWTRDAKPAPPGTAGSTVD